MARKKLRTALLIGGLLVWTLQGVLLGEVVVRRGGWLESIPLVDASGASGYVADPELGYKMRPNARLRFQRPEFSVEVRTNAQGYRDREFGAPEDGGDARVAVLGDSFAWGHGVPVERGMVAVAESQLRDAGKQARLYNLATLGYGQRQHLAQLDSAASLGCGWVLLVFCPANDVLENAGIIRRSVDGQGRMRTEFEDGPPQLPPSPAAAESGGAPVSALARFARARLGGLPPNPDLGGAGARLLDLLREDPSPRGQEAYAETARLLMELRDGCAARGMQLAVVIAPQMYELWPALLVEAARRHGVDPAGLRARRVSEMVLSHCEAIGVPVLDMGTEFSRAAEQPRTLFFPHDRHYNRVGHRLAGTLMAGFLEPMFDEASVVVGVE